MHCSTSLLTIQPLTSNELPSVIDIHIDSLPNLLMTLLGRNCLGLFCTCIANDPDGVILTASVSGRVEGFVAGVTHQSDFYRRLIKKHKWSFAASSFRFLIRRPGMAFKLVKFLNQPAYVRHASAKACLLSLAVRRDAEGKGIGKELVKAFIREMNRRNVSAFCLTTDRDNNERANGFYTSLGFRHSRSYVTPQGQALNEYVISLENHISS